MTDQPKRFYCVGLPKAGTHSLAEMVAPALKTAHEPEAEQLIRLLWDVRRGVLDAEEARGFLRSRDERLDLEFESSHLLGAMTPHIVEAFPDAQVLLLVRECRSWIDSMINDQLNLRSWPRYQSWVPVYEYYLRCEDHAFPVVERVLQDLDLFPLRNYVRSWCRQIRRVVEAVPPERLLMLRTHELASSADELAGFLGVKPADLDMDRSHSYKAPRKHHLLDRIGDDYVRELIAAGVEEQDSAILLDFV